MGDRSNIVVKQDDGSSIYLYGHWMGEDSINVVANVLGRRVRWSDTPYLTRMLFEEMISNAYDKETGYGISTTMCDNQYPIIVLNPLQQTAWIEEHHWTPDTGGYNEVITGVVSFEEMVNACVVAESFPELASFMGSRLVAP